MSVGYLQEEREEVEVELKRINAELNFPGKKTLGDAFISK